MEESEYCLPFDVGKEEMERGERGRVVRFRDEQCILPALDMSAFSLGLGIDLASLGLANEFAFRDDKVEVEEGGFGRFTGLVRVETGSRIESDGSLRREGSRIESLVTDVSATESEWTAFSEEAEGIEMFF